jgi:hypothetical protein
MAKQRKVPKKIADTLSPEELKILQEALLVFDQGYRALMDRLKELNAPPVVYMMVNGSIKATMRKGRGEVNLGDREEMQVWGDGYYITTDNMEDLEDPAQTAHDGFISSQMLNGWLSYDYDG